MSDESIRVLLANDHAVVRAGIRQFLEHADDIVVVGEADDGVGFEVPESPSEFAPGGHFGLLGIHERSEMIGAKLEIHSRPSEGSQITVTVHPQNTEK